MNEITPASATAEARPVQRFQVIDPVAILDTARFEHMQRIAAIMARSNLIPDSLTCVYEGSGSARKAVWLPIERITANCFLVVNQAVRWAMDPFAVAQCVSVVHGKLCFEGKLIAAVIEAKLGIRLKYEWDNKVGDALGIKVSGKYLDEDEPRVVEGTVAGWKTDGAGSPWKTQARKQLAYRGAREWGRLHSPGIMLGVYSDDEMEDLSHSSRSSRALDVSTPRRVAPSPSATMIEHKSEGPDFVPPPPLGGRVGSQATEPPPVDPDPPQDRQAETRRAPSPSAVPHRPAKQEVPSAGLPYDPEKVRAAFSAAAKAAQTRDDLNDAYEIHVSAISDEMMPPDRDDVNRIYVLRAAEIDGTEGATP